MATTIINPPANSNASDNNGLGFLIGAVVLIVFGILFFVYVFPYIQGLGGNGGIQINVPKNIDVKVQQTK